MAARKKALAFLVLGTSFIGASCNIVAGIEDTSAARDDSGAAATGDAGTDMSTLDARAGRDADAGVPFCQSPSNIGSGVLLCDDFERKDLTTGSLWELQMSNMSRPELSLAFSSTLGSNALRADFSSQTPAESNSRLAYIVKSLAGKSLELSFSFVSPARNRRYALTLFTLAEKTFTDARPQGRIDLDLEGNSSWTMLSDTRTVGSLADQPAPNQRHNFKMICRPRTNSTLYDCKVGNLEFASEALGHGDAKFTLGVYKNVESSNDSAYVEVDDVLLRTIP
jgi:predicted small secreted protein